ncbi:hypothetical protein HPB51_025550 [Rhipicephalus microplus]|uniref:Uncharacterized protein n=1 Tax=Rhipicephalus microplus TaxID=6941 RepID=A0A9J6F8M0_RHIMP|nr:hypothetical protein HPB51_025550 [Rhipicephalus microplus]
MSLQQDLQHVKAGYEEKQRKLRRILKTKHSLVANSQKAQFALVVEALKKAHKAQIEKMKEDHASAVEQLAMEKAQQEQHMAENTSAIQEIKTRGSLHRDHGHHMGRVCHRS